MEYEPTYWIEQQLVCTEGCGWVSDFRQVFRDTGCGDGDLIDGPDTGHEFKCPGCGERVAGKVSMFWADRNPGVLFVWDVVGESIGA